MDNNSIVRFSTQLGHISSSIRVSTRMSPRGRTTRTSRARVHHHGRRGHHLSTSASRTLIHRSIQIILLIRRLDSDYQIGRVGNHHVGDLIERLAAHLDAVHLDHFVVNRQQTGRLGQSAGHQTRDEYTRDLFHTVRGDPQAAAVADVEAEWFTRLVFVEAHATIRVGQDVHVDDG